MKDGNYKMLQWSKEIIDEIIRDKEKYSKDQLIEFLQKMGNNFHLILLSEAKNFEVLKSKN